MNVNWDDDSQYMEKYKMFQTTNQKSFLVYQHMSLQNTIKEAVPSAQGSALPMRAMGNGHIHRNHDDGNNLLKDIDDHPIWASYTRMDDGTSCMWHDK